MKRFLFFLFLLPMASAFTQTTAMNEEDSSVVAMQRMLTPYVGSPFPDFSTVVNDSIITNQSLKGKTVFINFWFESCAPCVAEFDGLNQLYTKIKDSNKFVFLAFTFEKSETIEAVRKKYEITYPIISVTPEECRRLLQRSGYPTSMIVDKQGKIVYAHCGGATNKEKASDWVMKQYYPRLMKLVND